MSQQPNGRAGVFQHPLPAGFTRDIESWANHPHLRQLRDSLHAHTDEHTFLNATAEAMVARYLLSRGCDLRLEVPTPSGKQADFEANRDGERFYLHVKRLDTQQPAQPATTVTARLRVLEQIRRPYIVSIRWSERASNEQ